MTGFGKASTTIGSKKISIEIRSLNSKSLDLNTRMPSIYKELDTSIRKMMSNSLGRGKIDFALNYDIIGENDAVSLNEDLAKAYYTELKKFNDSIGETSSDYLGHILRMPDVFSKTKEEIDYNKRSKTMPMPVS